MNIFTKRKPGKSQPAKQNPEPERIEEEDKMKKGDCGCEA